MKFGILINVNKNLTKFQIKRISKIEITPTMYRKLFSNIFLKSIHYYSHKKNYFIFVECVVKKKRHCLSQRV